jgi:hypothetical protein
MTSSARPSSGSGTLMPSAFAVFMLMIISIAVARWIGSPKTVRAKIEEMRDKTGLGVLLPMCQFGVLSDELANRNVEMFAAELMPHLRG